MIRPSWFTDDKVMVINARTCGINKDGVEQYEIDLETGERLQTIDDELAKLTSFVTDKDFKHKNISFVELARLSQSEIVVPAYFDRTYEENFDEFIATYPVDFEKLSIGELISSGELVVRKGHGSPSSDQRVGDVPYIKVSDLRAGQVNVNPTNRIPRALAEKIWRSKVSGLIAYDLISPERASKNIGEFGVLLPGQEEMVLTKEMLIFRGATPRLSQFYLMWALSLEVVRRQWERVVFMQTNREDVGTRYLEILVPYPKSDEIASAKAQPFKSYFEEMQKVKAALRTSLNETPFKHHVFFV